MHVFSPLPFVSSEVETPHPNPSPFVLSEVETAHHTPSPFVSSEVETPGAAYGVSTTLDTNGFRFMP